MTMTEDAKTAILLTGAFICFWTALGGIAEMKHDKICYKHRKDVSDFGFMLFGPLAFSKHFRKLFICDK